MKFDEIWNVGKPLKVRGVFGGSGVLWDGLIKNKASDKWGKAAFVSIATYLSETPDGFVYIYE